MKTSTKLLRDMIYIDKVKFRTENNSQQRKRTPAQKAQSNIDRYILIKSKYIAIIPETRAQAQYITDMLNYIEKIHNSRMKCVNF